MTEYLLSSIIFMPMAGALLIAFLNKRSAQSIRIISLVATVMSFLLSIVMAVQFSPLVRESLVESFQFIEKRPWISLSLGGESRFLIEYHLGVDGISLPLVLLSTLILVIGVISSWNIQHQVKGYFILYLLLAASIIGCFLALDLFLFYLFFELMLLPMFFLIGIWGGPRRSYASIKFFIYTLVGSLLILAVMIGLYLSVEENGNDGLITHTFNILKMIDPAGYIEDTILDPGAGKLILGHSARFLAFIALMVGFAIKLPVVPFHTWLPDAHVEAPTPISVILAALLLKVGGYGFYRLAFSIFPGAAIHYAYPIAIFGVVSIIYGGLNAMAQRDLKRLIAYSSVSHMGFVLVGLASLTYEGATGGIFHMMSHGLISAGLFLIAGVIYDRTSNRSIENYSGLASRLPYFTFMVVLLFFASLGLPGLSGFVGEIMVFMGAFSASATHSYLPAWIGFASISGIIISAAYYLWTLQRMFFGKYWVRKEEWELSMVDLNKREWIVFLPLAILVIAMGIFPRIILDPIDASVNQFTEHVIDVGRNYLNK